MIEYFKTYELVDRITYEKMGDSALSLFNSGALQALIDLRKFFDRPITVNDWHNGGSMQWRGWRTPEKAAELGAPHSYHARGMAFDCTIKGYTAVEARAMIMANQSNPLLAGIMRIEANVPWLHFDVGRPPEGKERIYLFKA